MRAVVFTDPALASEAGRFVWLEIDTDRPENAYVLEKYPLRALPTYFIVEPDSERIALRWVGGATVPGLKRILNDGHRLVENAWANPGLLGGDPAQVWAGIHPDKRENTSGGSGGANDLLLADLLARADRYYAAEQDSMAAVVYRTAIDMAPDDWASYGRAVESALFSLSNTGDNQAILKLATEAWPRLGNGSSAAAVATSGLDAAAHLPDDAEGRKQRVAEFEAASRKVLNDATIPATGDDRSGIYITLIGAREALGDSLGALALTREWANFLDKEAKRAPTPEARAVFDSHRLSAYLELNEPAKAVTFLLQAERDLPADYNPPARLAAAYKAMKDYPKALEANSRALDLVYGPRQLRVLDVRADIQMAMGDNANARATLEKAIQVAEAMPESQRSPRAIANFKKKLEAIPKT
ncbi:MAG: thiol reductase thioredoxin [Candidatus Eisenbacteria bacterium]|nr:thiol reductase thioredoxin [Candidatus Eisenbacteria bacterium]